MEIWLVQNGARTGPFAPYDIEGRITRGELEASQPAWHDGMAAWATLGEMPAFAGVFARAQAAGVEQAAEQLVRNAAPPLRAKPLLIRRFLARWFDLNLVNLVWWGGLALAGQDLTKVYLNTWLLLVPLLPWLLIESLLMRRLGTTPGKALLGLRVTNLDGSNLSMHQALLRTMRVLSLGVGLTVPLIMWVCQALNAWLTWRMGAALWDFAPGHRLDGRPVRAWQVILFGVVFLGILQLTGMIMMPVLLEAFGKDMPPWLRELAEQSQRQRP
jgi:uncharacterized RDD family membrane protein YckC